MYESILYYAAIMNNTSKGSENITGTGILWYAFERALKDLIEILPYIAIVIAVISFYALIGFILTKIFKSIFRIVNIDEMFGPLREYRIKLSSIIILLLDIGIALLAVYTIAAIIYPSNIEIVTSAIIYTAKIASVIFIIMFTFILLEAVIERIHMEAKMRGFMFLLILFITLALILDVTALSSEVKYSLAFGISLGIGLMIGVFAAWYFFHDLLEKKEKKG